MQGDVTSRRSLTFISMELLIGLDEWLVPVIDILLWLFALAQWIYADAAFKDGIYEVTIANTIDTRTHVIVIGVNEAHTIN